MRRCWPAPSPASRCSIFAPAAAARPWRWRPRWKTRASSTPPTTTSAGSRRSTTGWSAPARATSRSARRSRSATSSPISKASIDLVLIDAPCTGIGAWRRNPDAKWRVRPGALEVRVKEQAETLDRAVAAGPAGRPHRLHHLFGAGRGKRRANPGLRRPAPGFFRGKARRGGERARRARLYVQQGGAGVGRRPADDAAPDRHRRVFRQPPAAFCMTSAAQARQTQAAALEPAMEHHDKILIVDFGSQVTQLIARRVREEKVYSEIVPYQKAAEAFARMKPTAVILSGGPASVLDKDAPLAPQGAVRRRRAGARHLLRRAGDGASARRQGRGRPSPRVRPRRGAGHRGHAAVRGRLEEGREISGLDEPRRPRDAAAAGLPRRRHLGRMRRSP